MRDDLASCGAYIKTDTKAKTEPNPTFPFPVVVEVSVVVVVVDEPIVQSWTMTSWWVTDPQCYRTRDRRSPGRGLVRLANDHGERDWHCSCLLMGYVDDLLADVVFGEVGKSSVG